MIVFLREAVKEDAYLKSVLERNALWKKVCEGVCVEELEMILFDVGPDAATNVNLDLSVMQIDDAPEVKEAPAMPEMPTRKMSDEFDDFD